MYAFYTLKTYKSFIYQKVSNLAFPRSQIMESLIHVIKQQPKLAKEASSSLVDIGQAIHGNVTADELNTLFGGTLVQEIYARTSCLQTLQVILSGKELHIAFNSVSSHSISLI